MTSEATKPPPRKGTSSSSREQAIQREALRKARAATNAGHYVAQLAALRDGLGLSYMQLELRVGKGLSKSTAQAMLTSTELPRQKPLLKFLQACRVSQEDREGWLTIWDRLQAPGRGSAHDSTPSPKSNTSHDSQPDTAPVDDPATTATHSEPEKTTTAPPTRTRPRDTQPRIDPALLPKILAATAVLIVVMSGTAITMWLMHVPVEVIITVYGVVLMCVTAWTVIARAQVTDIALALRLLAEARKAERPPEEASQYLSDWLFDDLP